MAEIQSSQPIRISGLSYGKTAKLRANPNSQERELELGLNLATRVGMLLAKVDAESMKHASRMLLVWNVVMADLKSEFDLNEKDLDFLSTIERELANKKKKFLI